MIKLFDSYKKKLVEIDSEKKLLKIYSCGPTVYQYQHIGNLRAAWLPDTIVNLAKISEYDVEWVLNITDVGHLVGDGDEGKNVSNSEDKLEKAARAEAKKVEDIVEFYTNDYLKQAESINLNIPDGKYRPRATEYIIGQMKLALELVRDGRAYVLDDGIYFEAQANLDLDVPFKLENEGDSKFTGREMSGSQKNPADFALWKFVNENTLQKWRFNQFDETAELMLEVLTQLNDLNMMDLPNRWGVPGWHSECVVMNSEILGGGFPPKPDGDYVIDLHFGGEDHIDIHHKNEILQSEALGFHLSKYWVHNKFVLVDGKKMSKSLGNVYLINGDKSTTGFDSISEKGYDPLTYRMMLMEHHYTTQLDFTWGKLEQSQSRLYNWRKETGKIMSMLRKNDLSIEEFKIDSNNKLLTTLQKNLDIPRFLGLFGQLIKDIAGSEEIDSNKLSELMFWEKNFLKLDLFPNISEEIFDLADRRALAKDQKDYNLSDEIRDEITNKGYQVDDYPWGYGLWNR